MDFHVYQDLPATVGVETRSWWVRGKPSFPFRVDFEVEGTEAGSRVDCVLYDPRCWRSEAPNSTHCASSPRWPTPPRRWWHEPRRTTLAVVYDEGAASAGEIGVGLGDLGRVVFLVPDTPHNRLLRPVMENLGNIVALSGLSRKTSTSCERWPRTRYSPTASG